MKKTTYRLDNSGEFVIENYNRAKAFSSFFPGIAGLHGIPLWAFYVNRGQCICSLGIKDKDGALLEFLPANQAYSLTHIKGFRTFIRLKKKNELTLYEPFREINAGVNVSTKMVISPHKLELEETNASVGLRVNVSYITIPNEYFPGLARRLTLSNISNKKLELEVIDGLPQIVPFGSTEWYQKHMSRTIEAWMKVSNLDNNVPFYSLKVDPRDRPELEHIERGHFYAACQIDKNGTDVLETIVDPDIVFGKDGDISYPRLFAEDKNYDVTVKQRTEGKTPSAFSYAKFSIDPDQDKKVVSLIGNVKDLKSANDILSKLRYDRDYFGKKLAENEEIIKGLQNRIFTKSSSNEFDFYARQTFLDNMLRGGFPVSIATTKGPFVFYAYGRKHGDLERDYNAFLLQPSYYSQGNGTYRDMNQNRRNDVLFNPCVKDENILTFINAIQPDGFNPHLIEGIALSIRDKKALDAVLRKHIELASKREKTREFLKRDFTPGYFMLFLENEKILSKKRFDPFLEEILAISLREDVVIPGEGYWVDHWAYNIDLLENYLASFPEKLRDLLLEKKQFSFYDTYLGVMPRSEKYVYIDEKVRQFGSVIEDEGKKRIIESRPRDKFKVRTRFGHGTVYKTNLLVKLICVTANKMASLDPFGIGIEMEAGKPGWCDSLNGLPGIFGSSLSETFELKRLILFIKSAITDSGVSDEYKIALPSELANLFIDLVKIVNKSLLSRSKKSDFEYWDSSWQRRERYREEVWPGFSGKEKIFSVKEIVEILERFLLKIEIGLEKGFSKRDGMTYTYFINEVKRFSFIYENGKKRLNVNNLPTVKVFSFSHRPVSLFLEGPVHAMRIMNRSEAISLYEAVRRSELFDKEIQMYKLNAPLKGMPPDIGRSTIFTPGWLENESVWLHMEYKYLLELLKVGLYEEFFTDLKNCLVAFQDPHRYGRSILENSSFIVSSSYPDKELHGTGFVARLTGTTTEFLTIWLIMSMGKKPFRLDERAGLCFEPNPALPGWLFTEKESLCRFYFADGRQDEIKLAKNVFAFCLLGKTLAVYHNRKRHDTFGNGAVQPQRMILKRKGKSDVSYSGKSIPSPIAEKIREGYFERIDIELS